jgi:hypothetical protein
MAGCIDACYGEAVTAIKEVFNNAENKVGIDGAKETINELFQDYGFTNQERAMVLAELVKIDIQTRAQQMVQGAIQLSTLGKELELKDKQIELLRQQIATEKAKELTEYKRMTNLSAQSALVFRQHKNYDDALQKKVMETSGSYANYAIMANPEGAQGPLNNFKIELQNLKNRITQIGSIPVPEESTNGEGHLVETFTIGTIVATIEHRDEPDIDYIVSDGVTPVTVSTYEDALEKLMVYLELTQ